MVKYPILYEQHKKILNAIDNLDKTVKNLIEQGSLSEEDARSLIKSITQLSGIINVHLTMEDKVVYPTLMKSEDPKVRQISQEFYEKMKDIVHVWKDFINEWMNRRIIIENFGQFTNLLYTIIKKLLDRIELEDKILYPLL